MGEQIIDGLKDKATVKLKVDELQGSAVMSNSYWKGLDMLMKETKPALYLLRVTDSNTPHLHEIAKLYHEAKEATLGEISSLASLGTIENLDTSAVSSAVATAFQQRERDVVTDMARACSFVNPKHLFCNVSDMFNFHGASEECTRVIRDYYSGKENGASLIADEYLELDHFRTFRLVWGRCHKGISCTSSVIRILECGSPAWSSTCFGPTCCKDDICLLWTGGC